MSIISRGTKTIACAIHREKSTSLLEKELCRSSAHFVVLDLVSNSSGFVRCVSLPEKLMNLKGSASCQ